MREPYPGTALDCFVFFGFPIRYGSIQKKTAKSKTIHNQSKITKNCGKQKKTLKIYETCKNSTKQKQ
jgi:hypothetical protein